jgi:hypothetical protein
MPNYRAVNYDGCRAVRPARPVGGRPRKYDDDTVSVSFRVPVRIRLKGRRKARANRVNMTELMQYVYLDFVQRPIEEVRGVLEHYRTVYGPVRK